MIRRLQVLHYRAFKYIDIELSRFHILVGPNASGKSSFLDVFGQQMIVLYQTISKMSPSFNITEKVVFISFSCKVSQSIQNRCSS